MPQFNDIKRLCKDLLIKIEINVKTASLTSFKVGGTASFVVYPDSIEKLVAFLRAIRIKNVKYFIVGNGTNIYFCSGNYDGVIISTKCLNKCFTKCNTVEAQCGALLNKCCNLALENHLTGLEFCYGIPGSVGGAIYMNASAFGSEISSVVLESIVYDIDSDEILVLDQRNHKFSTKSSAFHNRRIVALSSKFLLSYGNYNEIQSKMQRYLNERNAKQPTNLPSAGSAFKRPLNSYASKLVDEAGLKGFTVGGAQISNKHAGFIINNGTATAENVRALISYVKNTIKSKYGMNLEEEIIYVE